MCIYTTSIPLAQINYSSTIAGGGKTYAATEYAFRLALQGEKVVIAFPTRQLCRAAYRDLLSKGRHPNANSLVTKITTDDAERVVVEVTGYLQNTGDGGRILFITHAAFEKVRNWWRPEVWHVIIDEVMPVTFTEKLPLSMFKHVLHDLLTHHEMGEWVRVSSAKSKQDFVAQIARNRDQDKIAGVIQPLAEKLTNDKWPVYIDTEQWHRWQDGEAKEIEFHAIYDIAEFARFKSVTVLSANLHDSIMYNLLKSRYDMVPHDWVNRNLRHSTHSNSHLLTIYYQTTRVHSKKLRNSDQFAQAYEANVNKLTNDEPFLLLANNGYRAGTYPHAVVLSNVPHGLNCYTKYQQVVIDAALNPTHLHRRFLEHFAGMDERMIRRGLLSSVAYQTVMRSSLRIPERENEVMLIVPDLDTAMDVRSYLPDAALIAMDGCKDIVAPRSGIKGGRPKIHANTTERKRAERARKKAQQQDNRQDNIA